MVISMTEQILYKKPIIDIQHEEVMWTSIYLSEILEKKCRFEANVFNIKQKHVQELLNKCSYDLVKLGGENGFIKDIFYPGRFKRTYIDRESEDSVGFLGSSEMLDLKPMPVKFLWGKSADLKILQVETGWVLLSRSGTIGSITYVSNTLKKFLVSEHAIRIICNEFPGYIYTYLKSKVGQILIKSNIYGAVVSQIEPHHLTNISIPNPTFEIKNKINSLIVDSFALRDESNVLTEQAHDLLISELNLLPIQEFKSALSNSNTDVCSFSVKLSNLSNRFDGSYHIPIVNTILNHLNKHADEVVSLSDPRISTKILLPARFKRVYVEEGQGTAFFGGKQIFELDPSNKKYLSLSFHGKRINSELKLIKNTVLVTRSGTIGKVTITPSHWENWIINEHVIRVLPANENIAGYIYAWLSSDYGYELITSFTYGAVVDEIDDKQLSQVQIPLLKDKEIQKKINDLVLQANEKRYEAYVLEQRALKVLEEEVLFAK